MIYYAQTSDELYHHGIKGQKWGVRRFQNEDGSVTAKGAKRYYDGDIAGTGGRSIMSTQKIKKPGFVKGGPEKINTEKFIKEGTTPIGSKLRKGARVAKDKISDKHTEKNAEEKSEKKGLSKKQKVAIGVGIAAVAAVGAYAAGVKIADAKANKAANEKLEELFKRAEIEADISISDIRKTRFDQKGLKVDKVARAMESGNQGRNNYSKYMNTAERIQKSGGRKGKSVKLSKENIQRLNSARSKRKELDGENRFLNKEWNDFLAKLDE